VGKACDFSGIEPSTADLIDAARGLVPVDLLIKNCRLVNVISGEIHPADVAVAHGRVVGFGCYEARTVIDAAGRYLAPGLIDGHLHVESTLLAPPALARTVAAHGTAAIVCDPHEIANVLGLPGIEWMLAASAGQPVSFHVMMPSCVPATHLETAGATLSAEDIAGMLAKHAERMPGLAEMMNFPGVIFKDPGVLAKLEAARGRVIDGHAPLLSGRDLAAYILAGPSSDHECTTADEAREKLRLGLHILIREGTAEHNLHDLIGLVGDDNFCNFSLVSDDRHPADLWRQGHMDHSVRLAISSGLSPLRAVQLASITTARHYRLAGRGAIAPGYRADMILLDDLATFTISQVFLAGCPVESLDFPAPASLPGAAMHVGGITARTFEIVKPAGKDRLRVIGIVPGQLLTRSDLLAAAVEDGRAVADPARDLAKLAVIERHTGSGQVGLGFVTGLGLARGAIASSVAHDSHNLIVCGMDDADMALAASKVARLGGGFVVAAGGEVLAELALPIAGLMSGAPLPQVLAGYEELTRAWKALGVPEAAGNPIMHLSFLALPVIPHLKLTDKGLVDVDAFGFTELWA